MKKNGPEFVSIEIKTTPHKYFYDFWFMKRKSTAQKLEESWQIFKLAERIFFWFLCYLKIKNEVEEGKEKEIKNFWKQNLLRLLDLPILNWKKVNKKSKQSNKRNRKGE